MPVLTSQQRGTLETAVKQARKLAEIGARNALHSLAVDHPEPFAHMNPDQRALRNRLRHKARLLGDDLPSTGNQQIEHLGYELAYENWHKMLFAKFLESNNLLMHSSGVAVTMEECEELAGEEGFTDKWDAAAAYASKMLPAIFRTDDPLMQVQFAADDRIKLEAIIDALESYIFTADDALGWVYQFWQSDAKAAINASGDKIDGAKLPAVTQLFTEPYMVHFLIDNTLGAWWVSRNPGVTPPVKFEYLRLLEDGIPAAGKFEGWPDKTADVTSLDPCMGSGHFVASLFLVFAQLRMYEEGLTKEEATDKVIIENLHGLELDARCTQIAAFNLALTAWKFCGHSKVLPEMNLACSGIAPKGKVEDWVKLVNSEPDENTKMRIENGMKVLYDLFQLAPELGSLLDPSTIKSDLYNASFQQLQPVLNKALESEADKDLVERGVMAAGIAKAGILLTKNYYWIITNVPYLGSRKQDSILKKHLEKTYPISKHDLGISLFEKLLKNLNPNGTLSLVTQRSWTYKDYFENFRKEILSHKQINFLSILGPGAFQSITGEIVDVVLISVSNIKALHTFFVIDLSGDNIQKGKGLIENKISVLKQSDQLINPDFRISIHKLNAESMLEEYGQIPQGIKTGDDNKHLRGFWELQDLLLNKWEYCQTGFDRSNFYLGYNNIINWSKNGKDMIRPRLDSVAINQEGIAISQTGEIRVSIFKGNRFDSNIAPFIPNDLNHLIPMWCYCKSEDYSQNIKKIDPGLFKTNTALLKVPFDLDYWQKIAEEKYPNGLPKPYSDDATQWLFHGHPIKAENPLQVAVARLLGYRWPAEINAKMELADEARELIKALKAFDYLSDEDGIFCIPSVNAEEAGADRLRSYLQEVFGEVWSNQTINQLLAMEGASSANLEEWLRNEFFAQHCRLFQNRPFIWNIWDGRNDGFSALVNYHMLTKENLSKLIYTYLGDWIRMCDAKRKSGESGADGLLSAALKLKEKLEAILEGEAPYDIFVRWKSLEQQPTGWEPDLNDGVRLNIRPFIEAGVLRSKFNIKWGVDRGKNPPGSHWGEVRDNDLHKSLEEKREARANKR